MMGTGADGGVDPDVHPVDCCCASDENVNKAYVALPVSPVSAV